MYVRLAGDLGFSQRQGPLPFCGATALTVGSPTAYFRKTFRASARFASNSFFHEVRLLGLNFTGFSYVLPASPPAFVRRTDRVRRA